MAALKGTTSKQFGQFYKLEVVDCMAFWSDTDNSKQSYMVICGHVVDSNAPAPMTCKALPITPTFVSKFTQKELGVTVRYILQFSVFTETTNFFFSIPVTLRTRTEPTLGTGFLSRLALKWQPFTASRAVMFWCWAMG